MPQININQSGYNLKVYDNTINWTQIGTVYNKELWIDTFAPNLPSGVSECWFLSPTGFRKGYIEQRSNFNAKAYGSAYDYGAKPNGTYTYKVRRTVTVYYSGSAFTTLYAGDLIYCDVNSASVSDSLPDRLKIAGYQKAGQSDTWNSGLSVTVGLSQGYSMGSNVNVYGAY